MGRHPKVMHLCVARGLLGVSAARILGVRGRLPDEDGHCHPLGSPCTHDPREARQPCASGPSSAGLAVLGHWGFPDAEAPCHMKVRWHLKFAELLPLQPRGMPCGCSVAPGALAKKLSANATMRHATGVNASPEQRRPHPNLLRMASESNTTWMRLSC